APPPPRPAPPPPAPAEGAPSLPDPPRVAAPPPRPAPPPQPVARPAQPAQKAAGAGGGAAAGNRGKAAASTEARASRDDLRAAWGAAIRARIERQKSYPPAARGAVGKVVVLVTVAPSGALVAARVAASSGHAALDEAALRAARAAAPFPPAPQGATVEAVSFRISVNFAR
ncbi:TonB family protein, partial [Gemmobacter sp.]|uniref:TonB family protein n=1 Tax=Gemmobacter sp. TaxID=1898957 RepID=UPI00391BD4AE